MIDHTALETLFAAHGYTGYRWMDPEQIVVAQWVRMKCTFGCTEYGHSACCPPSTPSVDECRQFFREYNSAVIFHFPHAVERPEDRHAWARQVNAGLSKLERAVFLAGYPKTFLLYMDSCGICTECPGTRTGCKFPRQARPSPEAMAVDVFSTVRQTGLPIQVLTGTSQPMNRYAFLLIE
jgi:predicted metal-binding protein